MGVLYIFSACGVRNEGIFKIGFIRASARRRCGIEERIVRPQGQAPLLACLRIVSSYQEGISADIVRAVQ